MKNILDFLEKRNQNNWLLGCDRNQLLELARQSWQELAPLADEDKRPNILLAESEPVRFLARFIAAIAAECPVFLGNPNWAKGEWQQAMDLVETGVWGVGCGVWGEEGTWGLGDLGTWDKPNGENPPPNPLPRGGECPMPNSKLKTQNSKLKTQNSKLKTLQCPTPHTLHPTPPLIMIPTGGTSGKIRFAVHTWDSLMASVQGFAEYFEVSQINSCCVLPLYHVSGLMQFMRSFTTGGKLAILPSYKFLGDIADEINPAEFFLSLVPTQLHRLLQDGETANWLSGFKAILLGGAPAWPQLLAAARSQGLPLAPTYGMTETASQVATLKPADFLAGNNSSGRVLPHAQITIRAIADEELVAQRLADEGLADEKLVARKLGDEKLADERLVAENLIARELADEKLPANQTGIVTIQARSLALGYYPLLDVETLTNWGQITDDLGFLDDRGYLNIVGRCSHKIVTGGENVFPAEVEAGIIATGLVTDVCVIGTSDPDWGQIVTAVYVPARPEVSPASLKNALGDKLAKYKQPKYWLPKTSLPRNAQGKVNRERLQELVKKSFPQKDGLD